MTGSRSFRLILAGALVLGLAACKSSEERAEEYYQGALSLIADGDVTRAIVELRNVFELDGSHRAARTTLAQLERERGNRQGAYSQYLRLAEQYPDDLDARIALFEIAFIARNWEEVERHGRSAVELAPEDPRVQAIEIALDYRQAVADKDDPARREAGRAAGEMLVAQTDNMILRNVVIDNHLRENRADEALAELDRLIGDSPENELYWRQRLNILVQQDDKPAIEAHLRAAVEQFPDKDDQKALLIRFLLSQKDVDKAETFLRELAAEAAPDETQPRIDLIRFLARVRGTEAAKAEVDAAIADSADPVPYQVLGAGLTFSEGGREEAIATLESVLANAEPSDETNDIKVTLAKMLLAMGNEVGARSRVEEVLAAEPTEAEALKMQARWSIRADDADGAIASLRTALDQQPEDAEAMSMMAEAYSRAGRPELSRDFLALAVEASGNAPAESIRYARLLIDEERYLPAEDILIPALRLDPDNTELLITLGRLYLGLKDFGRAQQVSDTLRRLPGETAQQSANAIEAERLNLQNGAEDAMAFLENVAQGEDASLISKVALVRARLGTGDREAALQLAEELAADAPDSPPLKLVLATARAVNGDLDGAESLYRDLLDNDPAQPAIWLELSRIAQRRESREAARAIIDEGLSHNPGDAQLLWAQASHLEQTGDIDGAIEIYEALYEENSGSIVVANNLASLLSTYREDEESLTRAWNIARRFSDAEAPAMQDTYGWIVHRRGESAEAVPYLEAAVAGIPNDALVQAHLGEAYAAVGRTDEALTQLERAVEIAGPADTRPQIVAARDRIAELRAAEDAAPGSATPGSAPTDSAPTDSTPANSTPAAPDGTAPAGAPAVETDDPAPASETDDAAPASETDDAAPASETDDAAPASETDDATPASETDDAAPAAPGESQPEVQN